MTNAIYWDTSALVKLYAAEPDSADYRKLMLAQREEIAVSFLHRVELCFALHGKEVRGEIAAGAADSLHRSFKRHLEEGRYLEVPWGEDVAAEARVALEDVLGAVPPAILRSLDGLHLGAARAARITRLVTTDLRMSQAAAVLGFQCLKP